MAEEKSFLLEVLSIVGIVAIVGIILLFLNQPAQKEGIAAAQIGTEVAASGAEGAELSEDMVGQVLATFGKRTYLNCGLDKAYNKKSNIMKGDINDDGSVDILDYILMHQIVLGKITTSGKKCCYDINKDGKGDIFDLTLLYNNIVGIESAAAKANYKISQSCTY